MTEPFFVWDESISVGVPLIDHDHQYLVNLINQLHDAVGRADERAILETVLDALIDYAVYHFSREERVMEACGMAELSKHRRGHEIFARKVLDIQQRFRDNRDSELGPDVLIFLKGWLQGHIVGEDRRIREYATRNMTAIRAADLVPRLVLNVPGGFGVPAVDWSKLKILVVDANKSFRKVLSTILSTVDATAILEADSGQAALAILRDFTPDVVVSDWYVEDMDGIELFRKSRSLRAELDRLPFVLMTGPDTHEFTRVARADGIDQFLEKPITAKGLLAAVAHAALARS